MSLGEWYADPLGYFWSTGVGNPNSLATLLLRQMTRGCSEVLTGLQRVIFTVPQHGDSASLNTHISGYMYYIVSPSGTNDMKQLEVFVECYWLKMKSTRLAGQTI